MGIVMTDKQYLIIEDNYVEIDNLTEIGYDTNSRKWCDITINVKELPTNKVLLQNTSDFYILKDHQLFFVKVELFNVSDRAITITPKWCTYLNL